MIQPLAPFTDSPPALGPYSLAVQASGDLLFVSGMTPYDPAKGSISRGSIAEQTRLVLENIRRVLENAGASLADVASCRVYLNDLTPERFAEMNAVYAEYFGSTKPARATLGVVLPGFDVEIECVAVLPNSLPDRSA
ncbi:MAG: RidA family protein [Terrimicrobiaceae bacterium]